MVKAKLEDVTVLKDAIQTISSLISEGKFTVKSDGLHMAATDPTMVTMVDFTLAKEAFTTYEFEKEETLGMNIDNLNSIIKRASNSETITIETQESKCAITLHGDTTRTFSLPLLNLDNTQTPDVDNLDFTTTIDVKSEALKTGIGDASVVGESITFRTTENSVILEAKGDNSTAQFTIDANTDSLLNLEGESVKSSFSLGYLSKAMRAEKIADTVTIKLGNDFPLKLEFNAPEKCQLHFVLAPRIEEE